MNEPLHFPDLVKPLKRLLKEKGINYKELGRKLKLSESSVKKVLTAQDCSLSRLNELCAAVGVSLPDLMAEIKEEAPRSFRFTSKQENFLLANRKCFLVYWKLVYEEWPLPEIRQKYHFTEAALFKILRSLDQIGLIELLPDGKVKYPDMSMVLWESEGALVDMVRTEWMPMLMRRIGEAGKKEGYAIGLRYFTLRPESRKELIQALTELQYEFGRRSVRETRLNRKATVPVFMVNGFAPSGFVEELAR